jgi:4,5:9,10-diseco-3-hydroxy-5,9,17-trioxoandrosta-1(10),2-diene-4-oate hydrolase
VLAQRHRVYALDLLGFGRTDKLPLVSNLFTLVQFASDFMDTQGIDKASLVGNSLGGGLVLQFAIRFPQKVEKLVLISNAGMGRDVNLTLRLFSVPVLGKLLVGKPSLKSVEKLLKIICYDPAVVTPELVKISHELATLPGASKASLAITHAGINIFGQRAEYTRPVLGGLKTIAAPTLIFWGRQDRIIPVKHAQVAAAKIPLNELHVLDGCGHCAMFERPEEFNKITLDFLAK